jgi:polynucleotide 5'-hydroxyl-kinase GRC3/NOL9
MIVPASLDEAVARASGARLTVVLGATDVGKTSLVARLGAHLLAAGRSVGVVDADLGQSEIGPPTTVGLGRPRPPAARPADAEVVALAFVGATSPAGHLLATAAATHALAARARRLGLDHVLVDTSGLVRGEAGRRLKRHKLALVDPDLVICLERAGECEPILRPYAGPGRSLVLRVPAAPGARRRSPEERRRRREAALARYLAGARRVALDLERVPLLEPALHAGRPLEARELDRLAALAGEPVPWAVRVGGELVLVTAAPLGAARLGALAAHVPDATVTAWAVDDLLGVVAGLEDARGETLGIGVVRALDVAKRHLVVETPVPEADVAGVRLGRHRPD